MDLSSASMKQALGDHTHVGDVRGEGMICAIEFFKDKDSRTFFMLQTRFDHRFRSLFSHKTK